MSALPEMDAVARTARWVAAARARETARPDRLFDDPFALALAGPQGVEWLEGADRVQAGGPRDSALYLIVRTRYFDDFLLAATREEGFRQVVLVAAGMDSRAFRLPWSASVRLFELDQPELFTVKERILRETGAVPRTERHTVAVDLEAPWIAPLLAAGFDPETPTLWLVEGLLVYLDEAAVASVFAHVTELSAPGSRLGADLGTTALLTAPGMEPWHRMLEERGCPWRFGTDDPAGFLARFGWHAEAFSPGDPRCDYGRWPSPAAPGTERSPTNWLIDARRRRR